MHDRPAHRSTELYLAQLLVVVVAGCRLAEGAKTGIGTTALTRLDGYLEVTGENRIRDQESLTGGSDSRSEERLLTESLHIESDGYVYHPNLVAFSTGFLFGLIQNEFESEPSAQLAEKESGRVIEYDFIADLVREKRYPGTVYAHRYEALEPRPFFTSVQLTTEEYGANWSYLGDVLPTRVQWSRSTVSYEPLSEQEEGRKNVNDFLRVEADHAVSRSNRFSLVYEHESVSRSPTPVSFDVDDVSLNHELVFGAQAEHRLDSSLSGYTQKGTIDVDRVQFGQRLSLEHTENLHSRYSLDLRDREQGSAALGSSVAERSWYVSGLLGHQLYDNLTSEVGGSLQVQDFDNAADIDRASGFLSFDYYRNNPWGVLRINTHCSVNETERRGSGSVGIVDEQHTFVDPSPIVLAEPSVDVSSIVITDLSGTQIYVLGQDYSVFEFANRVEISRIPTGLIANGETVLIDYVVLGAGDGTLETWSQNYTIRQTFSGGWSPFYRLQVQNQTLTPGGTGSTPAEDIRAQTVGLDYRRGPLNASAEYTDYDSDITPYESVRMNASVSHLFDSGIRGSLGGSWVNIRHRSSLERESEYSMIDASYHQPVSDNVFFDCRVRYLDDRDSASNLDNEGVDFEVYMEWLYRTLQMRIAYESGFFENNFSENRTSRVYFEVRRSL